MLQIEMMPAERGDAILVEYGIGPQATNRVLIDGGPVNSGNYDGIRSRLAEIPTAADGRRYLDLLIVTHVDTDHVEGVIRLLQDDELRCVFDDVWFNGWRHLVEVDPTATVDVLGGKQGEFLGALLQHQGRPWNQFVKGGPLFVPDVGELPTVTLRGGLRLTLLSPTVEKLERMAKVWGDEVRAAGFEPGDADAAVASLSSLWWAQAPGGTLGTSPIPSSSDGSEANGSSIAVLAEFGETTTRSVLLAGDAHVDVLTASLRRLKAERGLAVDAPLAIDAFKLSHHGSKNNVTGQLFEEVLATHYLISTSGDRFNHPDAEAIAGVRSAHSSNGVAAPELLFNYRQPNTTIWDQPAITARFEAEAILRLTT